jgi:hypothetical protein
MSFFVDGELLLLCLWIGPVASQDHSFCFFAVAAVVVGGGGTGSGRMYASMFSHIIVHIFAHGC